MGAMETELPRRDFPGTGALADLAPPVTAATEPQAEALRRGRLLFQVCGNCGRWRALVAPVCPHCAAERWEWRAARGGGTVVSWVRYHRAYVGHYQALVPYVVLCVEMEEGFRIFGRLAQGDAPAIGERVSAIVERWADGGLAPAFVAAKES